MSVRYIGISCRIQGYDALELLTSVGKVGLCIPSKHI